MPQFRTSPQPASSVSPKPSPILTCRRITRMPAAMATSVVIAWVGWRVLSLVMSGIWLGIACGGSAEGEMLVPKEAGQHRCTHAHHVGDGVGVPIKSDQREQGACQKQAHGQRLRHGRQVDHHEPESLVMERVPRFAEYKKAIQHEGDAQPDAECQQDRGYVARPQIEQDSRADIRDRRDSTYEQ